ncbi:MAG: hypothetical protein HRT68_04080 [Flavobacteriaceae bacterium]|nr:hypothetical protein [Flavobacteriaceae bacterium]
MTIKLIERGYLINQKQAKFLLIIATACVFVSLVKLPILGDYQNNIKIITQTILGILGLSILIDYFVNRRTGYIHLKENKIKK